MKHYGLITHVGPNVGTLASGPTNFRFQLGDFPNAEVGNQVYFEEDQDVVSSERWAKDITLISHDAILERIFKAINKIEEDVATIGKNLSPLLHNTELPESFFREQMRLTHGDCKTANEADEIKDVG